MDINALPTTTDSVALIARTLALLLFASCLGFHVADFRVRRRVDVGAIAWNALFLGTLAFLGAWAGSGLVRVSANAMAVCGGGIFLCGVLSCMRGPVLRAIERMDERARAMVRIPRDIVAILIAAVIGHICIELPYNENVWLLPFSSIAFSVGLILAVLAAAYALTQRNGAGPAVVAVACLLIGIAQYFILSFKGAAILPSDLFALGTAAAVSGQYEYALDLPCLQAIALACASCLLLSHVRATPTPRRAGWPVAVAAHVGVAACIVGALAGLYNTVRVDELLQYGVDNWQPIYTYRNRGFLPCFILQAQRLAIPTPAGYTDEDAQAAEDELAARYDEARGNTEARAVAEAQFQEIKPTVIAVMNESFSDLSVYDGLTTGYEGPTYFNTLEGALQRGHLSVSVLGGGTCNSEFEFVTGNSLAFIGAGKYPYMLYSFKDVDALPRQFGDLGYKTTAIHPQNPANWNRSTNYREMGFDEFISIDDFDPSSPVLHAGYTDATTYGKILDLLREDDSPRFILDITMQNHGGYEQVDVPDDMLVDAAPEAADDTLTAQVDEYASLIAASDRDLEAFINELRGLGRPVALVFFGDHQPGFSSDLNDLIFPGEDEDAHNERLYQTSYFIWTNYEVAGVSETTYKDVGASTLAATALDYIGAPLTDYQRGQLGASLDVPAINQSGYRGADGLWYALDAASPYADTIDKWRRMQYLEFAKRVQ